MKRKIGRNNVLYPMPSTIVGTIINGKVNWINIAHVGILNAQEPHRIMLGMNKLHASNQGILENKTFSVNIVSSTQILEADYVGLVSGKTTDKSKVFDVFYGDLKTAPMIENCPLSMECKLVDNYSGINGYDILIGEVIATYAEEKVLKEGKIDLLKVDPLLFDMSTLQYYKLGVSIGGCWNEGKKYQPK